MIRTIDDWIRHFRACAASPRDVPASLAGTVDGGAFDRASGEAPAGVDGVDALWWAACDARVDVGGVIDTQAPGALFARGETALEVWTENELSGMHALWRVARVRDDVALRSRAGRALVWHLEHTQPDNATNRPWAAHVFVMGGTPDAEHYAATLVHNAMAVEGRVDPLSARILDDAARELELV